MHKQQGIPPPAGKRDALLFYAFSEETVTGMLYDGIGQRDRLQALTGDRDSGLTGVLLRRPGSFYRLYSFL